MINYSKIICHNVVVCALYWGVSHLNWMIFSSVGVLPMPVWPAAGVAILYSLYIGWAVAPGIAVGVIFATHFSLGASWAFAVGISVMNTLGPELGAELIRRKVGRKLRFKSFGELVFVMSVGIGLVPLLAGLGGITSKYILGLLPDGEFAVSVARWSLAHSFGNIILAMPVLVWIESRKNHE